MSVRLSVRSMKQLGSQERNFHETLYVIIFQICLTQFKFHYNLTRITSTLHEDARTFVIISR